MSLAIELPALLSNNHPEDHFTLRFVLTDMVRRGRMSGLEVGFFKIIAEAILPPRIGAMPHG